MTGESEWLDSVWAERLTRVQTALARAGSEPSRALTVAAEIVRQTRSPSGVMARARTGQGDAVPLAEQIESILERHDLCGGRSKRTAVACQVEAVLLGAEQREDAATEWANQFCGIEDPKQRNLLVETAQRIFEQAVGQNIDDRTADGEEMARRSFEQAARWIDRLNSLRAAWSDQDSKQPARAGDQIWRERFIAVAKLLHDATTGIEPGESARLASRLTSQARQAVERGEDAASYQRSLTEPIRELSIVGKLRTGCSVATLSHRILSAFEHSDPADPTDPDSANSAETRPSDG